LSSFARRWRVSVMNDSPCPFGLRAQKGPRGPLVKIGCHFSKSSPWHPQKFGAVQTTVNSWGVRTRAAQHAFCIEVVCTHVYGFAYLEIRGYYRAAKRIFPEAWTGLGRNVRWPARSASTAIRSLCR
jgi:hypothetical protein